MLVNVTDEIFGLKKKPFKNQVGEVLRYGDVFVDVLSNPNFSKTANLKTKVRRATLAVKMDDIMEASNETDEKLDGEIEITAKQATDIMNLISIGEYNNILVKRCAVVLDQDLED